MVVVEMAFAQEEENGIRGGPTGVTWRGEVEGARPAQRPSAAAGRQRPGHAGHGWAGMAAQNRGGGALMFGPHGTVPVGCVKRRSINFKINLN
jgi:hypothetical protein